MREALRAHDFAAEPQDINAVSGQFELLADLSEQQERFLHGLALRREPSEFSFPPQRTVSELREQLDEGQQLLAFFALESELFAFSLSRSDYSHWPVESTNSIRKLTASLLREWGHYEKNSQLKSEQLHSEQWKQLAGELLQALWSDHAEQLQDCQELVIVPDGFLWYLPFEALQLNGNGRSQALISATRLRYAPTASLGLGSAIPPKPLPRIAVVPGKLFGQDHEETSTAAIDDLTSLSRQAFVLASPQPAPTRFTAPFWDQLIVMQDVADSKQIPYDWAPVHISRGQSNVLADWFQLPWGAPQRILLPGFHTAAENALKRPPRPEGQEIFLTVCGLMSSGPQTVLISRWRPGGQISYDLVREFARELPYSPASSAWQRSVQLARQAEMDPTLEPRLRWSPRSDEVIPTGEHPFFWAGPMLIDTGRQPEENAANIVPAVHVREN